MKNITRGTTGSASCLEGTLQCARIQGTKCRGLQKEQCSEMPWSQPKGTHFPGSSQWAGELQRAAGTRPFRKCGSTVSLWHREQCQEATCPPEQPPWGSTASLLHTPPIGHTLTSRAKETNVSWEESWNQPNPESLMQYSFGKMPTCDIKQWSQ